MRRGAVVLAAAVTLASAAGADAAWYSGSWKYRAQLTLNGALVPAAQTSFPVLVAWTADAALAVGAQADADDILFTAADGATKLDHEIESYTSATGALAAWVRVPSLASGSNTTIYMYYGNPAAASQQNKAGVWDASFRGVWHLAEAPANGVAGHFDSTTDNFTGTPQGFADGTAGSTNAVGIVSRADNFLTDTWNVPPGNTVNRVEVPDNALLRPNGDMTVEAWINLINPANGQFLVYKWDNGGGNFAYQLAIQNSAGSNYPAFQRLDSTGTIGPLVRGTTPLVAGTWYHVAGVRSGTTVSIYLNGNLEASSGGATGNIYATTPNSLVIGACFFGQGGLNGREDEVRFSGSARSGSWLRTGYNNLTNQGVGSGKFILASTLEMASCCGLVTSEVAGSTVTVAGPNQFEMRWSVAAGGGVDQFYDLAEDPTRTYDLMSGDSPGLQAAFFSDEIHDGTINRTTASNSQGARLYLLEATPARVRVREDAFYQDPVGGSIRGGMKGYGDYSLYGVGRLGLGWERRTAVALAAPSYQQLQWTVHYTDAVAPLNAWTAYSESFGPLASPWNTGGGAGSAGDDFVLAQSDQPGARTDFLTILSQDWPNSNRVFFGRRLVEHWEETSWIDDGPSLPIPVGSERVNAVTYFKPTALGSTWPDPAVTSRSADYRVPDALSITVGGPWNDPGQLTASDHFNEAEGAYLLTLDPDPGRGLTFEIDGTVAGPRYSPFFKIRQWRSFIDIPFVTLDPDGGGPSPPAALRPGVDYRSAVKPISRAHWASTLNWHCTMEGTTACDSGNVDVGTGVAGSTSGTTTVQAGRYGNALRFDEDADGVSAAASDFNRNIGAIDFWYQPFYNHDDGGRYLLWYNHSGSGPYDCFVFLKDSTANALVFAAVSGATDTNCTIGGTLSMASAAVGAYSWRAYDWVHLKTSWTTSGLAGSRKLRIVMNGVEIATSATFVAPATSSTPMFGGCSSSCPLGGGANANGLLDEVSIYGGLDDSSYDTNSAFAHAGLTSDAGEYLADTAKNWSLGLTPVAAGNKGSYLYLGADSPFRGLNVALQTPGVWSTTPGDLVWEFWNGTQWATLESGYGFTDQTNTFTRNGTIYWTGDPFNWSPYSVNGGPDLYYVRLHLAAGALTYSTPPVERLIKTDILLFQYCSDVTAASQQLHFGVPATTVVRLMSFTASPGDGSVTLEWRTGSELDNLGFHLYRAPSADGPWTRLTSSLIPGLGSSPVGQAYSWLDSGLANGTRYYYRLEDVDTSAKSTFQGPVSAVPSPPGGDGGGGGGGDGTEGGGSDPADSDAVGTSSCPSWVLAAAPDAISPVCTRHGDPDSTSVQVLARDASGATLELHTGGFWALQGVAGEVRVFVPGLEFPSDPKAPALPLRRTLVEAIAGKGVELVSAEALELQTFRDLRPSAVGAAEMRVDRDGTVRPARRALAAPRLTRGTLPHEVARLTGTVFQGERKSAVVEITPVRFSCSGLVLAGRVRVRLAFAGVAPGESGAGRRGRSLPRKRTLFRSALAQLHTSGRGLHAVTFEQLFPAGSRGLSTALLRLQRQDEAVAFHVEPAGPLFGPGSTLFFYADHSASSTDYSPEVAYELVRSSGVQMGTVAAAPLGAPLASSSVGSSSFETNRIYQPGLLEARDLWLWEYLPSGVSRTEAFTVSGVDTSSGEPARLTVYLQGGSASGQAVDHHVELEANGTAVGETSFAGKRPQRVELSVPASLLEEGSNELSVRNVGDTGVVSGVFLDRFELSYPQSATVRGGVFEGVWAESGTAEVTGLIGLPVILRGDGSEPGWMEAPRNDGGVRWLTGFQATGSSVRFQAEAGYRYLVVSPEGLLAPRIRRVAPSTLKDRSNQADYVVIAPRAFLDAAIPLIEWRRSQGLRSQAVSFEEVVSEFGHGQASAEAIREFLKYAYHSWQRPSPRYVLLLGDATDDPQRHLATSWPSPLPALLTRTTYLWTASDPAIAAVNGEDALADLAIGRLPATTQEEAEALVAKLLTWEETAQGLEGTAVFVADKPDAGGDFEADVEDVRASFLAERATRTIEVAERGPATRGAILEAFDEGASVMSYVGHGGTAVWSTSNVLASWDAPSLRAQSRQPVLLTMNCLNGYFVAPNFDALPEALLKVEGRGVVAAVSPSGLSLDGPAHEYHRAVMAELASGRHERLGDAILAAQGVYAQSGLMPELLTVYQLLGDPALRIR